MVNISVKKDSNSEFVREWKYRFAANYSNTQYNDKNGNDNSKDLLCFRKFQTLINDNDANQMKQLMCQFFFYNKANVYFDKTEMVQLSYFKSNFEDKLCIAKWIKIKVNSNPAANIKVWVSNDNDNGSDNSNDNSNDNSSTSTPVDLDEYISKTAHAVNGNAPAIPASPASPASPAMNSHTQIVYDRPISLNSVVSQSSDIKSQFQ